MKTKIVSLPTIKEEQKEIEQIDKIILKVIQDEIYIPLIRELNVSPKKILNSQNDVIEAIMTGKIHYYRGKFRGKWNSKLSLEMRNLGAKWDKFDASFKIQLADLPMSIQMSIKYSQSFFDKKISEIDKKLASLNTEEIVEKINIDKIFDKAMFKYSDSLKHQMKSISVSLTMTPERIEFLKQQYVGELKKKIKGMTAQQTQKLRTKIQKDWLTGKRSEDIEKYIRDNYSVSANRASFIARQEMRLVTAAFKQQRMQEAGIKYYAWRCVPGTPNHPTRPRHKELNDLSEKGLQLLKAKKATIKECYDMGLFFKYGEPPVVTEKGEPERRAGPGQDYHCRCSDRALILIED